MKSHPLSILFGHEPTMSHDQIAARLSAEDNKAISRERVRQIERDALAKVKLRLGSRFNVRGIDDLC